LNRAMHEVLSKPNPKAPLPLSFSVIRIPFFLEPHYDESRPFIESNRDRLVKKWGGKEGWEAQKRNHNLKGRGMKAGIPHFNLDRLASNTMASHRLIQLIGKKYGLRVSEGLYDRLNYYYFVEGHALNDKPRLASVACKEIKLLLDKKKEEIDHPPPMTEEEILSFLNGNEGRHEIEQAGRMLNKMGVHGIPKFIIEGQRLVDGSVPSETFVQIFREIESKGEVFAGPVFGSILGLKDDIILRASHTTEELDELSA